MQPDGSVGLAAAIEGLRYELAWAAWWGRGQRVRFKPGPVELTVQATVTSTKEARAGVRWWVLEAGGSGSSQTGMVQTLKITLEPAMFDQAGVQVEQLIDDVDEPTSALAAGEDRLDDAG